MLNTHIRDNENSLRSEHFPVQRFRGLHLRRHPDDSAAATDVLLIHADEIVMDDGTRIGPWDTTRVVINASGAGGLDTGLEAPSTWYEIYAIAKDDGTKNLLLHRAKDYFEDETSTAGEDGQHLLRDAAARTRLAQGFQVDTAGKLAFVDIKIAKIGAPSGEIYVTIQDNAAGVPGTTIHATSDKLNVANISTTSAFIRFVFRTPLTTVAATQYHLVLNGTFAVSATNHVLWRADTTAGAYANGSKAEANNGTWTADADDDFIFKIFVTRNDAAVTMPAGYTKKAKIGWIYNNSSSNFDGLEFVGRRAHWFAVKDSGAISTAEAQLIDFSAAFPPVPVTAMLLGFSSVANDRIRAMSTFTDSDTYMQLAASAVNQDEFLGHLRVEYQSLYVKRAAGTGDVQVRVRGWEW